MDQSKNKADLDKQSLIADLEQTVETLRCNAERIQFLEKSWSESEWYLGEAKARNQRLEDEARERDFYIRRVEEDRTILREQHEKAKAMLEAEKARCAQLEEQIEQLHLKLRKT